MIFHQLRAGGCLSYIVGCDGSCGAAIIDPETSLVDHYTSLVLKEGLRVRYLIDTRGLL